jgi:hypothetical protein
MQDSKEAIEKIVELSAANIHNVNDIFYTDKKLYQVKEESSPDPNVLNLCTLSGVVDYLKNKLDDEKKYTIHISNYNQVEILGEYEPEFGRRKKYVSSVADDFTFRFGNFYPHEEFMIALQAQFSSNYKLTNLLKITGNIISESNIQTQDDGITQMTTIRDGIVNKEKKELPNPISLIPKRTFPEVEQPETEFIFRIRKTQLGSVELALFESSGGYWRVDCIHKIRDYLNEQLEGLNCVIIA